MAGAQPSDTAPERAIGRPAHDKLSLRLQHDQARDSASVAAKGTFVPSLLPLAIGPQPNGAICRTHSPLHCERAASTRGLATHLPIEPVTTYLRGATIALRRLSVRRPVIPVLRRADARCASPRFLPLGTEASVGGGATGWIPVTGPTCPEKVAPTRVRRSHTLAVSSWDAVYTTSSWQSHVRK